MTISFEIRLRPVLNLSVADVPQTNKLSTTCICVTYHSTKYKTLFMIASNSNPGQQDAESRVNCRRIAGPSSSYIVHAGRQLRYNPADHATACAESSPGNEVFMYMLWKLHAVLESVALQPAESAGGQMWRNQIPGNAHPCFKIIIGGVPLQTT